MNMQEYAVATRNLTKIYNTGNIGVKSLNLQVKPGEIYGLIGPNGSGKTTTLRIIATLLKPTTGEVHVFGIDVVRNPLEARKHMNYLPEEAGAYRDLTGLDFLRFMLSLRFSGRRLEEAISDAVEIADLGEDIKKPIRGFSKGMKRIIALSAVLASRARLLILDEPTSGLDVENSIYIRDRIRKYNKEIGTTVLLSSHNMLEVEYLCDRIGILYRGNLLAEGTVEELKNKFAGRNLEEVFLKIKGALYDTKTSN
jgi:ABC-2 type transport system ATP-binding protein